MIELRRWRFRRFVGDDLLMRIAFDFDAIDVEEGCVDTGRTATQAPAGADVEIGSRGCEGVEPVQGCSIHISQTKDYRCDAVVRHDALSLQLVRNGASVECQGLSDS